MPYRARHHVERVLERVALLATTLLLLHAPAALAFSVSLTSGNVIRWPKVALTYSLHPAGSADVTDGSDLKAVRDGFAQWQAVGCTSVGFTEKEPSTNLALTAVGYGANGKNEVAWIESSDWLYGTYVLGITAPVFYADGAIIEADIALNGAKQTWTTTGKPGAADVLSVVLHEEGHFLGLSHVLSGYTAADPPTMAPTADPDGKSATLQADDEAGVCFLYPKGAGGCASGADCPYIVEDAPSGEVYAGKLACEGGQCGGMTNEVPGGDVPLGAPCSSTYDCQGDGAFCQLQGVSGGVCAVECASPQTNDCPAGLVCLPYSNAAGGVCMPDAGPGPSRADGEPCATGAECASLMCVGDGTGAWCRSQCALGDDAACGAGHACMQLQGQPYGACAPSDAPVKQPDGAPCEKADACEGGLCVGAPSSAVYTCASPCQDGACAEGFGCQPLVGGGGVCLAEGAKSELGAVCENNQDCKSDVCIQATGPGAPPAPFCSQPCGDCPCGMACVDFQGGEAWCEPGPKVACVPDGNPCAADGECAGGVCLTGVCAQGCTVTLGGCAAGEACRRLDPGGAAGVCEATGAGVPGAACEADADCATLLCDGTPKACLVPCSPAHPACGDAFVCEPVADDLGGCVAGPPPGADAGGGAAAGDASAGGAGDAAGPGAGLDAEADDTAGGADAGGAGQDATPTGSVSGAPSDGGCAATGGPPSPLLVALALAAAALRRRRGAA